MTKAEKKAALLLELESFKKNSPSYNRVLKEIAAMEEKPKADGKK